jgi:hypothetical protein
MEKVKVRTLADIEAYEKVPIDERLRFRNTYDLIKQGAALNPEGPAISFFPSGAGYASPQRVTYRELLAKVTQTANLLYDFGVKPGDSEGSLGPFHGQVSVGNRKERLRWRRYLRFEACRTSRKSKRSRSPIV